MSFQPPPGPPPSIVHVHAGGMQPTNVPGVVGFVMSMIGLLGICFTPIFLVGVVGAIISFFGMMREPRGLAIAGFIVGVLQAVIVVVIVLVFGLVCGGAVWSAAEAGEF